MRKLVIGVALLAALGVACVRAEAETPRPQQQNRVTREVSRAEIGAAKADGMSPFELRIIDARRSS